MNVWGFIYRVAWSVLAVILLFFIGYAFYPPIRKAHELQATIARKEEENRLKTEMLEHLRRKQERLLNDPRFVEKIAREELGYAKPGELVFKFTDDEPTNARIGR